MKLTNPTLLIVEQQPHSLRFIYGDMIHFAEDTTVATVTNLPGRVAKAGD